MIHSHIVAQNPPRSYLDLSIGVLTCMQAPFSSIVEIVLFHTVAPCTIARTTVSTEEPLIHFSNLHWTNHLVLEGGDCSLILVNSNDLATVTFSVISFVSINIFGCMFLHHNGLHIYNSKQEIMIET